MIRSVLVCSLVALIACSSEETSSGRDSGARDGAATTQDSGSASNTDSGTTAMLDAGATPDAGTVVADAGPMEPGALGCRAIMISTGQDGDGPTDSVYLTTAFGQPDVDISEFIDAQGWQVGGPLMLCAGPLRGVRADLTLQSDVTFAVSLPLDNCLCRQYLASGSSGTLYCGAMAGAFGFRSVVDSMGSGAAQPPVVMDDATAMPNEGDVRVRFKTRAANISASAAECTPAACTTALASENIFDTDYTTGIAVSSMTNTRQGGDISIEAAGHAFDDDPNDGTNDCEDWTTATPLGALSGAPGSDEDNDAVGSPKDVVTIERIAE
jgi:hypothetical protein